MWPILLNMTRDECRQTIRRLELEAYSNMMNVFRAQGALEDNRKKLLEELRAVLHISRDRHSAEARRVSNDELLATIAEQLAGPNTGLGWISEGRRLVPLLPRGIPQTMYTEVADKVAESSANENKDIKKRVEEEKSNPKLNEEVKEIEGNIAENTIQANEPIEDLQYSPIAMEDQSTKVWETELICRKRKIPESGTTSDDASTPVKKMRNIPVNSNQKHLNLSQIYSRFSQPTGKSSGHSKHSYNQVSKVSTSKSQSHCPTQRKPRLHKQKSAPQNMPKLQRKSQEAMSRSSHMQYNPVQTQSEYQSKPISNFQNFTPNILTSKPKPDYMDEIKTNITSSPSMVSESSSMQLLTQPATVPHELEVFDNSRLPDVSSYAQAQGSGKHCHLVIKKRNEIQTDKKVQITDFKILQKPADEIKILSNRQVVVAASSAQKAPNPSTKFITTKVVSSVARPRTSNSPIVSKEKMIVVSKGSGENRLPNSKIVITSSPMATPNKDLTVHTPISNKTSEALTPKGIPATDLKVSAKTFVVNPKSGQKMVVVPAKGGKEGQMPLFHFKGIPTARKLVSLAPQPLTVSKPPTVTVMSKPTIVGTLASNAKIIGVEPIKTANLADIVPVKGRTPVPTQKATNPIVRPVQKGNVIVVQKGTPLGKAVTFTKNGSDMSKIIMGKNVNQLLQANKPDTTEAGKSNVIVLELNNEHSGRTTTMSEILDSRCTSVQQTDQNKKDSELQITQDTPVLFESQINDEACNTSSLDSAVSMEDIRSIVESSITSIEKVNENKCNFNKENISMKEDANVTEWDMELETVPRKGKEAVDKLNSLHLDLGMSSDSESEFIMQGHKTKSKHSPPDRIQSATPTGVDNERYTASALSLTTRTLLSQLHEDGSSSNDSSLALRAKSLDKFKTSDLRIDKSESEALSKAKAKLSEKVAEAKSQQKRIDVYSTAITTSDINLDSFSYLDENIMAGDDVFPSDNKRELRQADVLGDQLSRLLGEDSANSTDSQTVSDSLSLSKS